jgi:threonine synthase
MKFIETRGNDGNKPKEVTFSYALLNPSASFGGLYSPLHLPTIDAEFLIAAKDMSYKELAYTLFKIFDVDISDASLKKALDRYDSFDSTDSAPVVKIEDDLFVCELYHGPTRAFKDMALQPFGSIFSDLAGERGEKYLVMTATSGDTGPAALKTFKNAKNVKVVCLYPEGGTSDIQKLQMVDLDGDNLKVIGIDGSFDDAQSALKSLLGSSEFQAKLAGYGYKVSAANSVNFGRIAFQIVYHFYAYLQLLAKNEIKIGEKIDVIVPSGNFGNALGAYYAKRMGLPLNKINIASNANNILTELLTTGSYDLTKRELVKTISPAMDILISSNIERILFDKFGSTRTKELMDELVKNRCYKLTSGELEALRDDFDAVYGDDEYAKEIIARYSKKGYLMDPHTALCVKAYKAGGKKTVMYSTAEWTKFSPSVLEAIEPSKKSFRDRDAIAKIKSLFSCVLHPDIEKLLHVEMPNKTPLKIFELENFVVDFIKS